MAGSYPLQARRDTSSAESGPDHRHRADRGSHGAPASRAGPRLNRRRSPRIPRGEACRRVNRRLVRPHLEARRPHAAGRWPLNRTLRRWRKVRPNRFSQQATRESAHTAQAEPPFLRRIAKSPQSARPSVTCRSRWSNVQLARQFRRSLFRVPMRFERRACSAPDQGHAHAKPPLPRRYRYVAALQPDGRMIAIDVGPRQHKGTIGGHCALCADQVPALWASGHH
jgi:hypothetical protein